MNVFETFSESPFMQLHSVRNLAFAFLTVGALVGCSASAMLGAIPPTDDERAAIAQFVDTEDSLRALLSGSTRKTHDPFHGTQIEYFAPNGFAYLWYPGNRRAVRSFWKTETDRLFGDTDICFLYSPRSYNPVTKEFGGSWECREAEESLYLTDEIVRGDPLGLESGRLPYVLPDDVNVSVAAAMQRAGRGGRVGPNLVTWDWRR